MKIYQINDFDEIGKVSKVGDIPFVNSRCIDVKSNIEYFKRKIWDYKKWCNMGYENRKAKVIIFHDILRKRTFYAEIHA